VGAPPQAQGQDAQAPREPGRRGSGGPEPADVRHGPPRARDGLDPARHHFCRDGRDRGADPGRLA
jgi:hypothetical protein